MLRALLLLMGTLVWSRVRADTPANCTYDDIVGSWTFYETERSGDNSIDCTKQGAAVEKLKLELVFPSSAMDQFGNAGTWTMIYNQGFEVTVNGRTYFGFSDYEEVPNKGGVISYCHRIKLGMGWSHDVTVRNWACFSGKKTTKGERQAPKFHPVRNNTSSQAGRKYRQEQWQVDLINSAQQSWVATIYPHLQDSNEDHIHKMKGGRHSVLYSKPKKASHRLKGREETNHEFLPESWDWRNVDGQNYVSEVRDQGQCGSCYAFSSLGMLESRVKILTRNTKNFTFSPQDVVSCSPLSQGCEGGFPYLVAGRYGKSYGVLEEDCMPYRGTDDSCGQSKCIRHYTASYSYVGGYYGGCSETAMKRALVENGPLAVSFEVYDDFMMYKSGVYHHTNLINQGHFEPFEVTNHAVVLVGYGHDPVVGEDYWIIKNSWSTAWGEDGYFRIRRGTDECSVESIAVEAIPIP